jgi:hypothetical protein
VSLEGLSSIDCLWSLVFDVTKSNSFAKPYSNLCGCMFFFMCIILLIWIVFGIDLVVHDK